MRRIITIIGLPGSGKTTLAKKVAARLNAIHINADWARSTVTSHLGFTEEDRAKQACTLGHIAALTVKNQWTVVDFVNPTHETRMAYFSAVQAGGIDPNRIFTVFMNTIQEGRFEDTNKLFQPYAGTPDLQFNKYLDEPRFEGAAKIVVEHATHEMRTYHIRFNTLHNGSDLKWRIIDATTGEERLASSFDLRGHMTPSKTVEYCVEKYNVCAKGFPSWDHNKFILEF